MFNLLHLQTNAYSIPFLFEPLQSYSIYSIFTFFPSPFSPLILPLKPFLSKKCMSLKFMITLSRARWGKTSIKAKSNYVWTRIIKLWRNDRIKINSSSYFELAQNFKKKNTQESKHENHTQTKKLDETQI